jgi:hypothetical protein
MSDIRRFLGAFVWQHQLENYRDLNARLLERISVEAERHKEEIKYSWTGQDHPTMVTNHWSNKATNLFTDEEVKTIVLEPAQLLQQQLGEDTQIAPHYSITAMWWNRYPPGTHAPIHTHGSAAISGVYIVEQNEPCPLMFNCPNLFSLDPHDCGKTYQPEAGPGTVIMFPSALVHWVQNTQDWRATVSFNLTAVY